MGSITETVDKVFIYIIGISIVLLVLITLTMVFFVIRYSRKRNPTPSDISGNLKLEITWTVLPTLLVLAMFYWGYEGFLLMRNVPKDAMTVRVTGRMWEWSFEYDNGRRAKELFVPAGKPIKLLLKSADVLHSFYIPSFRVKEDVIPGRETYLWFKPEQFGQAVIYCAEYCGQRHAYMMSKVIIMPPDKFAEWYGSGKAQDGARGLSLQERALTVMRDFGCTGCHSTDGSAGDGPTFRGLLGKTRTIKVGGKTRDIVADEAYIRSSVRDPGREIVKGWENMMPQDDKITDAQIQDIIDYIKTLK